LFFIQRLVCNKVHFHCASVAGDWFEVVNRATFFRSLFPSTPGCCALRSALGLSAPTWTPRPVPKLHSPRPIVDQQHLQTTTRRRHSIALLVAYLPDASPPLRPFPLAAQVQCTTRSSFFFLYFLFFWLVLVLFCGFCFRPVASRPSVPPPLAPQNSICCDLGFYATIASAHLTSFRRPSSSATQIPSLPLRTADSPPRVSARARRRPTLHSPPKSPRIG